MSPGTSAAALGEEHGGQPHPLDEFEEPVLLAMAERALGAGEHGVVVGQHGARAALVAEQVAVDAGRARDEPVGGGARDQVGQIAAKSLGGDREPPVLDERARIDQILDILPRGSPVACVPAFDRIGARRVFGERATPQQFGVIVAESARQASVAHGV